VSKILPHQCISVFLTRPRNPPVHSTNFCNILPLKDLFTGYPNIQWQGFIRKTKLFNAPESFEDVIAAVVELFLEPLAASIAERRAFKSNWTAPGPWR
jgi:hypothetical protein